MVHDKLIKNIFDENLNYVDNLDYSIYDGLEFKQNPKITLVTCSDSRLDINTIKKDTVNYLFSIRCIGNQFKTAKGSIDYGILHLKTPLLVFLGHTNCGAIKAGISDYSNENESIKNELDYLNLGLKDHGIDLNDNLCVDKLAEVSLDYQISLASLEYKDLIDNGDLMIIGLMLDLNKSYGNEKCKIYLTNINNEKNIDKLKKSSCLKLVNENIVNSRIKRLV